jgi:hypothetical protein
MLAALVNAVGASSGTGAALLPLRSGGFLFVFGRRSRIDGKSGEDEIITTEFWCAMGAGEEERKPAAAILGVSSRKAPMRLARPSPPQKALRAGSFGTGRVVGVPL